MYAFVSEYLQLPGTVDYSRLQWMTDTSADVPSCPFNVLMIC